MRKFLVYFTDFSGKTPKDKKKVIYALHALEAMDKVAAMNASFCPVNALLMEKR